MAADVWSLAIAAHQAGQAKEAGRLYKLLLKANPRHTAALNNLAALQYGQGEPKEALRQVAASLKINPNQPDALNTRGVILQALGRPDEALAAYARAIALKGDHVDALINQGNAHRDLGAPEQALASYDRALACNPRSADALNNRGVVLQSLLRLEDALASFDLGLALAPDDAAGLNNRGNALVALRRFDEALAACERALALRPDYAEAHNNRANALLGLRRFDEALTAYDRAIAAKSGYAEAVANRATALRGLKRYDEALAGYDQAIALDPASVDAHWGKASLLILMGRYEEGWALYEWRWRKGEFQANQPPLSAPPWLGEGSVAGKSILLHAEQGLGDTLQMLRYVPLLARQGARVTLAVQPPLLALAATAEGAAEVIAQADVADRFDLHVPLMSLPLALRTRADAVPADAPYLAAPQAEAAQWRARLGPATRRRIGLAWSGAAAHANDHNRSIPLALLAPLLALDAEFISLQAQYRDADRATLKADGRIADFSAGLDDFADTAALAQQLDLVISVDTSVAHLAGALGKPVWILLPDDPDYRWGAQGEATPWYPTARLFRQSTPGDWDSVIAEVAAQAAALP
jgi:tetratricopeptide (TPR) repeat protein